MIIFVHRIVKPSEFAHLLFIVNELIQVGGFYYLLFGYAIEILSKQTTCIKVGRTVFKALSFFLNIFIGRTK